MPKFYANLDEYVGEIKFVKITEIGCYRCNRYLNNWVKSISSSSNPEVPPQPRQIETHIA